MMQNAQCTHTHTCLDATALRVSNIDSCGMHDSMHRIPSNALMRHLALMENDSLRAPRRPYYISIFWLDLLRQSAMTSMIIISIIIVYSIIICSIIFGNLIFFYSNLISFVVCVSEPESIYSKRSCQFTHLLSVSHFVSIQMGRKRFHMQFTLRNENIFHIAVSCYKCNVN